MRHLKATYSPLKSSYLQRVTEYSVGGNRTSGIYEGTARAVGVRQVCRGMFHITLDCIRVSYSPRSKFALIHGSPQMTIAQNFRPALAVFLVALLIGVGIAALGPLVWSGSLALHENGLEGHSPLLTGGFSILGVISKVIYDWLKPNASTTEPKPPFSFRSLARNMGLATLVAPLFLLTLHKTLADISDTIVVILICYQNGFMWQTLGGKST